MTEDMPAAEVPSGTAASQAHGANGQERSHAPPFLVAAVGASAGGLEAFSRLLRAMPANAPLALLLVQHLARNQHSLLPEILARRTAMRVFEAVDEMKIEPGGVYVIPAGTHMTVTDGHLRVRPRPPEAAVVQVDLLFRSLAECYRERAVGIVLSGGAADGTAGLREIKAAGGITIAQRPDDAQIDSMPRAAITAGAADIVLPVDEIGAELLRLAELPMFEAKDLAGPSEADRGSEDLYVTIFRLLRRSTGVDFNHYKRPTIARRIARRMSLRRLPSLSSYVELLQRDASEVASLQEDVLIHVTSFFREPDSFNTVKDTIFPRLLAERGDSPIRIWVPGCSTGEEVYSLAIVLFETLEEEAASVPVQFFGTDISKTSIEKARTGFYGEAAVAEISPERVRRFFSKLDGGYQIGKAIRERCVFARQDITRAPPFSRLHLIVCRNTLIYLGQAIQRRVISMMHYALNPNGFLMLGRAETTGANADLFSTFDKRAKIYRKKPSAAVPDFDFQTAPFEPAALGFERTPPAPPRTPRPWDMQAEANRLLLDRYAPPSVVVDSAFRIVSTRGATAGFLELPAGEATLDVLRMARPGLLSALRTALQEARHARVTTRQDRINPLSEVGGELVNLEVTPMGSSESPYFLISFERVLRLPETLASERASGDRAEAAGDGAPSANLLRELAATREQLHANIHDLAAANEELQSANEEILSSNEELQSTNEELDTAKEELQSTNEELSTLNEELHGRNEDLSLANSDLANLLASVQIPIVMVARDLTIRRFTPAAQRVLNLIPSDVGRPIGHIRPNISPVALDKPIAEVIETMTTYEREVEDDIGRAYLLRVRPYKSVDNRVDGAVLALLDVSATHEALSLATRTRDTVLEAADQAMLLLDSEQRILQASSAFRTTFGLQGAELDNQCLFELSGRGWDIPELRQLLEQLLPAQKNVENVLIKHDFPGVGQKILRVDARRIDSGKSSQGVTLLIVREANE